MCGDASFSVLKSILRVLATLPVLSPLLNLNDLGWQWLSAECHLRWEYQVGNLMSIVYALHITRSTTDFRGNVDKMKIPAVFCDSWAFCFHYHSAVFYYFTPGLNIPIAMHSHCKVLVVMKLSERIRWSLLRCCFLFLDSFRKILISCLFGALTQLATRKYRKTITTVHCILFEYDASFMPKSYNYVRKIHVTILYRPMILAENRK